MLLLLRLWQIFNLRRKKTAEASPTTVFSYNYNYYNDSRLSVGSKKRAGSTIIIIFIRFYFPKMIFANKKAYVSPIKYQIKRQRRNALCGTTLVAAIKATTRRICQAANAVRVTCAKRPSLMGYPLGRLLRNDLLSALKLRLSPAGGSLRF